MATGDVTLSIVVAGGATKTVTIDSATRVLAKGFADQRAGSDDLSADADWQVSEVNRWASRILKDANIQQDNTAAAGVTDKTFTAAS